MRVYKCKDCKTRPADHICENCRRHICDLCEFSDNTDEIPLCKQCKQAREDGRNEWRRINDELN